MRKLNGIFGLAVLGVLIIARSEIGLAAEHALRDELRGEIQQEQDPALRAEMQHQLELMDRSGELTDRDEQRSTENRSLPTATATDPSAPVEIAKADASDVEGQVDRVDVQEQKEIIRHLHKGTKPDEQAIADAFELSGEQAQTLKALPLEQLEPELERMHIKEEAEYWETLSEREHDADIACYATWLAPRIAQGAYVGFIADDSGQAFGGVGAVLLDRGLTRGDRSAARARIVNLFTERSWRRRGKPSLFGQP